MAMLPLEEHHHQDFIGRDRGGDSQVLHVAILLPIVNGHVSFDNGPGIVHHRDDDRVYT